MIIYLFCLRGFPVWLKYIPGISFRTDNEPFKVGSFSKKKKKGLILDFLASSIVIECSCLNHYEEVHGWIYKEDCGHDEGRITVRNAGRSNHYVPGNCPTIHGLLSRSLSCHGLASFSLSKRGNLLFISPSFSEMVLCCYCKKISVSCLCTAAV